MRTRRILESVKLGWRPDSEPSIGLCSAASGSFCIRNHLTSEKGYGFRGTRGGETLQDKKVGSGRKKEPVEEVEGIV